MRTCRYFAAVLTGVVRAQGRRCLLRSVGLPLLSKQSFSQCEVREAFARYIAVDERLSVGDGELYYEPLPWRKTGQVDCLVASGDPDQA